MILLEVTCPQLSTKQARGDSGKEPELHRWQNGEKKEVFLSVFQLKLLPLKGHFSIWNI